jgi:hypothetical protein
MVGYIEPVDVAEVTGAFDAQGRRLVLRAEGLERQQFGTTFVDYPASGDSAEDELRDRLQDYLRQVSDRVGMAESDIAVAPLDRLAVAAAYAAQLPFRDGSFDHVACILAHGTSMTCRVCSRYVTKLTEPNNKEWIFT